MKLSRVEQREKEKAGEKGRAIIRAPVSCGRTSESGRKVQVEPWSGGKQILYIGKETGHVRRIGGEGGGRGEGRGGGGQNCTYNKQ